MEDLYAAVEEIEKWSDERKADREGVVENLNEIVGSLKEAIGV